MLKMIVRNVEGVPKELIDKKGIVTNFLGKDKYVTIIDGKNTVVLSKDQFWIIPEFNS